MTGGDNRLWEAAGTLSAESRFCSNPSLAAYAPHRNLRLTTGPYGVVYSVDQVYCCGVYSSRLRRLPAVLSLLYYVPGLLCTTVVILHTHILYDTLRITSYMMKTTYDTYIVYCNSYVDVVHSYVLSTETSHHITSHDHQRVRVFSLKQDNGPTVVCLSGLFVFSFFLSTINLNCLLLLL